jgi:hypothetical protein
MAQQNRSTIKTFFETGDIPTEAQFGDSFDSQVFWVDDVETTLGNTDTKVPTSKAVNDTIVYTKDSHDNVFYKGVTATLDGNNNIFHQGAVGNVFGTTTRFNIIEQFCSGFTFGNGLEYTTIKSGSVGADYTATPDFDFLYNNDYPSEIFRNAENTKNYHRYYDPTNDRIVLTLLESPFTESYIGGGGGGGDVYLANDQTFTGENTFSIGSGNDTPVTITKGGNNAALKVTKSSGSGDAIEVAEGSLSIADETASTIASFDGSKRIKSLATSTYPSLTELALVKGVTGSAIQTQIDIARRASIFFATAQFNPVDSTTYYFSSALIISTTATAVDMNVGYAFKVIGAIIQAVNSGGTQGSSENSTLQLRNTTAGTSSSIGTFKTDATTGNQTEVTYTGLNISVAATDSFALQWDFPAPNPNPTNVFMRVNLLIEFL